MRFFKTLSALITICRLTGWFEKVINRIPVAIASALLAGVLLRFGLLSFTAAQTAPPSVLLVLVIYLAGIGSALWGVVAGALMLFVQQYGQFKNHQA